jgi:type II secretory pathway pseudopilin PulG
MMRKCGMRERGLSLVELLLGLAITALILAPLVPMLQTASAAAQVTGDQAALEREADFVIERIAARIRASDPANLLAGKPSSEWLKPSVYVLSNGSLVEQLGGVNYTLADGVTVFSLDSDAAVTGQPVVVVTLALARGDVNTAVTATVRMGGMP